MNVIFPKDHLLKPFRARFHGSHNPENDKIYLFKNYEEYIKKLNICTWKMFVILKTFKGSETVPKIEIRVSSKTGPKHAYHAICITVLR